MTDLQQKVCDALEEKLAAAEKQLKDNRGHRIDNEEFMKWKGKVDSARQNAP